MCARVCTGLCIGVVVCACTCGCARACLCERALQADRLATAGACSLHLPPFMLLTHELHTTHQGDVPTSASDGKPATPPAVGGAIRGSEGSGSAGEVEGGMSSPEITVDARGAAVDGLGAMLSRVRSMFSSPANTNSTEL